ncbi:MAG: response regulator transcription factor [Ahrensia sp.]|nr:response regulator transcription factor [Ahrensia sp.]
MRVLIVEDDARMADYIGNGLREAGHVADQVANGTEALSYAEATTYDLMVVDRMLPGLDGLSLVKVLRSTKNSVPILMLTSMGGVDDKVDGLEAGADDYLVKPFAFSELLARLNALARRPAVQQEETVLKVADLEMDLVRRTVKRDGQSIDLQPREFTLLEVLMRSTGRVNTRTMLLEKVWDFRFDPQTSVVETHISRLRAKVDKPFDTQLIHTIRNSGYSLHAPR